MRRLCLSSCLFSVLLSAATTALAKDYLLRLEIKSEIATTINNSEPVRSSDGKVLDHLPASRSIRPRIASKSLVFVSTRVRIR